MSAGKIGVPAGRGPGRLAERERADAAEREGAEVRAKFEQREAALKAATDASQREADKVLASRQAEKKARDQRAQIEYMRAVQLAHAEMERARETKKPEGK